MKSFNNYGPATRDLQATCKYKLRHVRVVYSQGNRGPAQRYLDDQGQTRYRPWRGVTGGKWIKGARCTRAELNRALRKERESSNDGGVRSAKR